MVWVVGGASVLAKPGAKAVDITGPKLVFVTVEEFNGDLGGLDGADAKCQTAAVNAGLSGVFQAWLSVAPDTPTTRFTHLSLGPYYMLNGRIIAENFADLVDGTIRAAINWTEQGGPATRGEFLEPTFVWTGTSWTGEGFEGDRTCAGWTVDGSEATGIAGVSEEDGGRWTTFGGISCGNRHRLYCFEQ